MRRALSVLLLVAGCGAGQPSSSAPSGAPRTRGPAIDVRPALATYRAHLAALNGGDREAYEAGFAERLSCYEGRDRVPRSEVLPDGNDFFDVRHMTPLELVAEPRRDGTVRLGAWVFRPGTHTAAARIEPRVARLAERDGRWEITSELAFGQTCGFDDGLSEMEVPPRIDACIEHARESCREAVYGAGPGCVSNAALRCAVGARTRPDAGLGTPDHPTPRRGDCSESGWCVVHPNTGAEVRLAVLAVAPDEIWGGGRGLWRFDGQRWAQIDEVSGSVRILVRAGAERLLAAGSTGIFERPSEGAPWRAVWQPAEGRHEMVTDLYARPGGEIWAVGRSGLVVRFDGREWRREPRFTEAHLWGLFEDPTHGLVAFGERSPWRLRDGYWEPLPDFPHEVLWRVHTEDGDRLLVRREPDDDTGDPAADTRRRSQDFIRTREGLGPATSAASMLRLEDGRWVVELDLPEPLFSMTQTPSGWVGVSRESLWTESDGAWTRAQIDGRPRLASVSSVGELIVIAGLEGVRFRRGAELSPADALTVSDFDSVDGRGPDDVWMLSRSDVLLHWDGQTLVPAGPTDARLLRWLAVTPREVLVGSRTRTWVRRGEGWHQVEHEDVEIDRTLRTGSDVVGWDRGQDLLRVWRWSGDGWEQTLEVPATRVLAVSGPRSALVRTYDEATGERAYVFHDRGRRVVVSPPEGFRADNEPPLVLGREVLFPQYERFARFDGRRWHQVPSGAAQGGRTFGWSRDDFYVFGAGRVYHRRGGEWHEQTVPGRFLGRAMWGEPDDLWLVGFSGVVLRRRATSTP